MPTPQSRRGVYGITVAAELVGMGVQTLRLYERRGLLEPARTEGGTRRYSETDISRLRRIGELVKAGLNLAGVALILDLEHEVAKLRAQKEAHQWSSRTPGTALTRRSPRQTGSSRDYRSSSRT